MLDWMGWLATAIFTSSYFCKRQVTLRSVQAVASLVWMIYGILIGALPLIVANIVVAVVAACSAWREHHQAITNSGAALPKAE